jgi:hypothetical protein
VNFLVKVNNICGKT